MSKNILLTEYDGCLNRFCTSYERYDIKNSDISKVTIENLDPQVITDEDGHFPEACFRNDDYPSVKVRFELTDKRPSYYYIMCYPNCCGVVILYRLDTLYASINYEYTENMSAVLKVLLNICTELGYGACQYICTSQQTDITNTLLDNNFVKIAESNPRAYYVCDEDEEYYEEEKDYTIITYQLNLNEDE